MINSIKTGNELPKHLTDDCDMLIQLTHLPSNYTNDDIDTLLCHMKYINCIHLKTEPEHDEASAWIELECSRVGVNAICGILNGRYINGHHISAYPSLYSH